MAMAEKKSLFVNGGNGGQLVTTGNPVTDLERAQDVARRYRCEFVDLTDFQLHHELFKKIPVELMFRYNFVPLEETPDGRLAIAIADPSQLMMIDEISLLLQKRIVTKVSTLKQISYILKKTEQSQRVLEEASEGFTLDVIREDEATGVEETLSIDKLTATGDTSPIIRLVDTTIFTALQRRASDIHIETRDDSVFIRFRIDGVLTQAMPPIGKEHHSTVISRIKVMSELDISERRVPQDGRFRVKYNGRAVDFRVSVMPSIHGEDAVLRVLDKQSLYETTQQQLSLASLGFDAQYVKKLRRLSNEPYGMLLVTGPTGSGKTTTLYAEISEINNGQEKIVTIEDPVEYQLPGVLQIPVNEKKGLTFARGLRSILRHDPDKIMVGEIRDPERAQIPRQSALTGHLVFTTVHANNVFDVVSRFVHMGVDSHGFVSALSAVLAQRLVRIVCEQCSEAYMPSRELLEESHVPIVTSASYKFRKGRGCGHCRGTGYHGRKAVGERMVLNDEIREAIVSRVPVRQLKELARQAGVRLIRTEALDLVRRGQTTVEEVNRVTIMA